MGAVDLIRALIADGVEFTTDGKYISWRNSRGAMTPSRIADVRREKAEVIDFLTRGQFVQPSSGRADGLPADAGRLLDHLMTNGPQSYGAARSAFRWAGTRAWRADAYLKAAGLVHYDHLGRAVATASGPAEPPVAAALDSGQSVPNIRP